jgi:hypothetical protein
MRKTIILALVVCQLLAFTVLASTIGITASPAVPELGDTNADGVINMADVGAVEHMIVELWPVRTWADANYDGVVDMADVVRIERIILGISPVVHP